MKLKYIKNLTREDRRLRAMRNRGMITQGLLKRWLKDVRYYHWKQSCKRNEYYHRIRRDYEEMCC